MVFSGDEEGALLHSVSNYHFHDEEDYLVCFSRLPLQFGGKERSTDGSKTNIFLRGAADDGLLKICKPVTAWKFDLSNMGRPEIHVLSKENGWLKLHKPRKSFEPVIRSVLITVHCLHLLRRNPDLSQESLWGQLAKSFSLYEVKPSQNDLVHHMDLIALAVRSDDSLAKSKFLHSFLEKPPKRKLVNENARAAPISGFIDDSDHDGPKLDDSNHDDDEDNLYDSVCAFCDDGGNIICCEGKCFRSFHPFADEESACESLGLTPKQVKALGTFLCENCEYNQHQCFACGKLGSSDKLSGAEVFRCGNATCGRFYHPNCVARLLHKGDKVAAVEHGKKISEGEFFTCPTHKCCVCQQGENKKVEDLQFALCRRCPTSYHRKCLPREIAFDDIEEEGVIQRAWDGLLDNRVLIYCLKHEIDDELQTPKRDHIKFPFDERKMRKASDELTTHEKVVLKKKTFAFEDTSQERTAIKAAKQSSAFVNADQISKKSEEVSAAKKTLKRVDATGLSKNPLRQHSKSVPMNVGKSSAAGGNKTSLGDRLFTLMTRESEQVKPWRQDTPKGGLNEVAVENSNARSKSPGMYSLDAGSERRLLELMKEAESSVTLEDIKAKKNFPSTHKYSSKSVIEKITFGKIEGSVEAVQMALAKLEDGCSIEDALAVCEPEVLKQITNWQNKFGVYLSPFLNGNRYTSFGRHFTKVDKLKEIVDRLHWYVQDGDTIVDFCCGANDFSLLMRGKLEETGKKCSFKNYDIFQAKNDFNFERRDWMSVRPKELPKGSQLIMGLNPPFGVKAALANKFIDKALEFKPKLLILTVPQETERLDEKSSGESPYVLVWEDNKFLSGKSFYLPGSVDANDKQMDQWNMMPPPLYLWSRHDFSDEHKRIAVKYGHLPKKPGSLNRQNDKNHSRETLSMSHQQGNGKYQSKETWSKNKGKHSEENHGRGTDKKNGGRTPRSKTLDGIPNSSPSNAMGSRSSAEGPSFKSRDQHQNRNMHGSHIPRGTSYGAPSHGYGQHTNKMNREFNMHSQAHLHGQAPGLSTQRNSPAVSNSGYGPTPSSSGQHPDATTNVSPRMHTSATQCYAPGLDESNQARMSPAGAKPSMGNRNAPYGPRPPPPFMSDRRPPRRPKPTSRSSAPGPSNPQSHKNSAGWLNE